MASLITTHSRQQHKPPRSPKRKYVYHSQSPPPSTFPVSLDPSLSPYLTPPASPVPPLRPTPVPISKLVLVTTLMLGFLMGTLLSGRSISLFTSYINGPPEAPPTRQVEHQPSSPPSTTASLPSLSVQSPSMDLQSLDIVRTAAPGEFQLDSVRTPSADEQLPLPQSECKEEAQEDETIVETYDDKVLEDFRQQLVGEMEDLREIWAQVRGIHTSGADEDEEGSTPGA